MCSRTMRITERGEEAIGSKTQGFLIGRCLQTYVRKGGGARDREERERERERRGRRERREVIRIVNREILR